MVSRDLTTFEQEHRPDPGPDQWTSGESTRKTTPACRIDFTEDQ